MEEVTDRDGDTNAGSPSSDGKMVIKLKIPKLAAAMEGGKPSSLKTGKEDETMNDQGKRVCPECKKEFSSGKALGGHMRVHVHVQSGNKNGFLKPSKTSKFKKASHHHHDLNNGGLNLNQEQQRKQRKPDYMSCVNDQGKPRCYLCGKIFPSMKSLFGHMRCHPDRLWRGILPPPNTPTPTAAVSRRVLVGNISNSSASSSFSENDLSANDQEGSNIVDEVVDLTKFLRGWSVTERRGRPALKEDDADEDLQEAVEDLMKLANSDPSMAESVVTQRQLRPDVFEGSNSNDSLNKIDENLPSIDLRLTDYGNSNGKGKGKAVMEEEMTPAKIKNFSDNESDSRNTSELLLINYKHKNYPYKKRKKMKLMMELDHGGQTPPPALLLSMASPPASAESKYKCTTCNKCFTTHQALGGHRSSHNKSKLTLTEIRHQIEEDDYESFLMNHSGQNEEFPGDIMLTLGSANRNSSAHQHQCKICDKNFRTGQALGGHKRCHWIGTSTGAAAPAHSSQVTSTGEAASQTGSGRKVLDFDLNEDPPMMMEEDEAGNGNGYASSSYNFNMG